MDSKKIKMIFDGRILKYIESENPSRSGIYFSAYHLFLELSQRYDFYLYSDIASDYTTRMNFPNIQHLSEKTWKTRIFSYLFYKWEKSLSNEQIQIKLPTLLRKAVSATMLILRNLKLDYKDFSNERVIFFSPYREIPKAFLREKILRFTLLHDCIPLVFDAFPKVHWFYKLVGGGGVK